MTNLSLLNPIVATEFGVLLRDLVSTLRSSLILWRILRFKKNLNLANT